MNKKKQNIKNIAILTSGGDSPGMNAAIRATAKNAVNHDIKPYLIYEGYKGLLDENIKPANIMELDKFISRGGTHIYSYRFPKFKEVEIQKKARDILKKHDIDALVVIGGDGSYKGAYALHKLGVQVIGIPGTIDNDIPFTDSTIGFYSAVNAVVSTIDNIRNTAQSHNRLVLIEVMGRYCPDIAIFAGIATGAEAVITNENIFSMDDFVKTAKKIRDNGKRSIIFVISELIYGQNGRQTLPEIAKIITQKTGIVSRTLVVGHIQRGATPTGIDRFYATRFGIFAVELLLYGKSGIAVGNKGEELFYYDINKSNNSKRVKHKYLIDLSNKINSI